MTLKRSLENLADKMGILFGSEEFSLKLAKWEGEKGTPYKFGMGPRWLNPALLDLEVWTEIRSLAVFILRFSPEYCACRPNAII